MSQKLVVPFKRSMMLCGYKNSNYKDAWGYPHYGIDISSKQGNAGTDDKIYGSGEGEVVAVGKDNSLGYGVAVLYKGCLVHGEHIEADLVARYMHMTSAAVKVGDKVTAGTVLGVEGKEGTEDYHLHLEFDTDTKYPVYSPQVSKGHTFWKKGTDSTLNPSLWLWQDEGRVLVTPTYNPAWLNSEDKNIPTLVSEKETAATPIAYDEDKEEDMFGEPAYYLYDKEIGGYRLFDKWWRRISTETFPSAGSYATEAEKKKAKAYTSDIKEVYAEATDPEGKAGLSEAASDQTTVDTGTALDYINEAIDILNKIKAML